MVTHNNSCGRYRFFEATRISRRQMIACCAVLVFSFSFQLTANAQDTVRKLDEVLIQDVRVSNKTPLTTSTIDRQQLQEDKISPAMPDVVGLEPSVVVTAENGTVGASSFRIRGVDATRINVNINGLPLNDAESQAVYWINIPNLGGMAQSVQIQRGVGASNGGSAAFGGALNIQTFNAASKPYGQADISLGSWNTRQYGLVAGSGLTKHGFSFDAAYNGLTSDGFVRGGFADQQSLFLSASHYTDRSLLKAIVILGKQKTGITWDGADSADLNRDPRYNGTGAYYDEFGNVRYYDNESDNYEQQHYQLYYSRLLTDSWTLNAAFDYTHGYGYDERYKDDKAPSKYNIPAGYGVDTGDFILYKDMGNHALTGNLSLRYTNGPLSTVLGGSYQYHNSLHVGSIIWAQNDSSNVISREHPFSDWYRNTGLKHDGVVFLKANYDINADLNLYADLQLRTISYRLQGSDDDYDSLDYDTTYLFFNPKVGVNYRIADNQRAYFVVGLANREPTRADIKDAMHMGDTIKPETMLDFELGYQIRQPKWHLSANLYAMLYKDQLVASGLVSESGYALMENVARSYRMGIELVGGYTPVKWFSLDGNITLSMNKALEYVYNVYDYSYNKYQIGMGNTPLAFSPSVVGAAIATFRPFKNAKLQLIGKYVGEQYGDNTGREEMKVYDYFLLNIRAAYTWKLRGSNEIEAQLMVNNVLDHKYRLSAWVSSNYLPSTESYDCYRGWFQQPGINFMGRVIYRF